jgi:CHAD domain-containing protein
VPRGGRSVLRTATPLLEATWAQASRRALVVGDELGLARDVDVLTEHLRAEAAKLDPADRRAGSRSSMNRGRGQGR